MALWSHDVSSGKDIVRMENGDHDMHFFYDAQGKPAVVRYASAVYGYVYNLQGDVIGIVDKNGTSVVEYKYDAWGKIISKTGSMAATLGTYNPFRYRGYVYDEETGLYYLRSRYYNPEWSRFLNADSYFGKVGETLSHNLFAYCAGNPVNRIDKNGHAFAATFDDMGFDNPMNRMFTGSGNRGSMYAPRIIATHDQTDLRESLLLTLQKANDVILRPIADFASAFIQGVVIVVGDIADWWARNGITMAGVAVGSAIAAGLLSFCPYLTVPAAIVIRATAGIHWIGCSTLGITIQESVNAVRDNDYDIDIVTSLKMEIIGVMFPIDNVTNRIFFGDFIERNIMK